MTNTYLAQLAAIEEAGYLALLNESIREEGRRYEEIEDVIPATGSRVQPVYVD